MADGAALTLAALVAQARALANDHPCTTMGHIWETEGGRRCPHAESDLDDGCGASQAVYRCARCGTHDYGEPGGPGARDCASGDCSQGWRARRRTCPPPIA